MGPCLLSLFLSDPVPQVHPPPPGTPGLVVFDVGAGAGMALVGSEAVVLVDAGSAGGAEAILAGLDGLGARPIDLWVVTHLDGDHVGGLAPVVAGLDGQLGTADDRWPTAVWDRGSEAAPHTSTVDLYAAMFADVRRTARIGDRFGRGDLSIEVVLDETDSLGADADENERGLALCVDVSGLRLLALADLPAERGKIAAERCGPVHVLWASHHGASDGTDTELLEIADPAIVLISAGRGAAHCHPAPTTLARLAGRRVWMTGAAGLGGDPCPSLAPAWDPDFVVAGGTFWVPVPGAAR